MKILTIVILLLALISCGEKADPLKTPDILPEKESEYDALLQKFEDLSFDTLQLYNEKEFNQFKGVLLDSQYVNLLPQNLLVELSSRKNEVYAIGKFKIDADRTGLIARMPAEYISSSIRLFVYDKKADSITSSVELANFWGDAGFSSEKNAWIFVDSGEQAEVFITTTEKNDMDDTETGEGSKYTSSTGILAIEHYYQLRLSEKAFDTIRKDNSLKNQFAPLLKTKKKRS